MVISEVVIIQIQISFNENIIHDKDVAVSLKTT